MRIVNLNPDTAIGASAWFVEIEGHRILLDARMHPKRDGREGLPLYRSIQNEEVDAIAISHCHHDHVGSLPVACGNFPRRMCCCPNRVISSLNVCCTTPLM